MRINFEEIKVYDFSNLKSVKGNNRCDSCDDCNDCDAEAGNPCDCVCDDL